MRKSLFLFFFLFNIVVSNAFSQNYRTHKVKDGDTVYSLSKKYNTTEEAIYKLNPGAEKGIKLGAVLVIPPESLTNGDKKPLRFEKYIVKPKETVFGISQQNAIDMADLKEYNPYLYEEELGIGDTLKIPIYTVGKPKPIDYNESIKNSSFGNLKHVVLPKETEYGIARKYGLKVAELRKLNPNMEVLQPGDVLVVSKNKKEKTENIRLPDNDEFTLYTVGNYDESSPETIFSLTRKFGISRDSLYALNPELKKEGLKAGMKLIVPKTGKSGNFNIFESEIIDLEGQLEYTDPKDLVLLLPLKLNKFEVDSVDLHKQQLRDERILRISLDFYSGVMMALEKAKEQGISTNLKVYDTQQDKSKIAEIIQNNNFAETEAVIGPLLGSMVETTAQQLLQVSGRSGKKVPVFSPLTSSELSPYENLFQTRPTEEWMREVMLAYLEYIHTNQNIVVITDGKQSKTLQQLKNVFPAVHVITESTNYLEASKISPLLTMGENWVIMESNNIPMVGSAVSQLSLMNSTERQIRLFTTNRNNVYESDEVSNTYLGNLNFTFPSIALEFNKEKSQEFIEDYISKYALKPSKYAVRGFDLTYDILLRLAAYGDIYHSLDIHGATQYAENKFYYVEKEKGGFVNKAVYIMHYENDLIPKPVKF